MTIKENVYYEVDNEEEAKWIVNKMYKDGYNWIDGSNRNVTDYYKRRIFFQILYRKRLYKIQYR